MLQSRTPITDSNLAAARADTTARIAAGTLSLSDIADRPARRKPVRGIAIRAAMTQTILEIGEGCAPKDLLGRYTQAEIDQYGELAAEDAVRRARIN